MSTYQAVKKLSTRNEMQKYNVVLYKDGVRYSKVSFGMSRNQSTYSLRYARTLAKDVRADKKFVGYDVRVEPTGI